MKAFTVKQLARLSGVSVRTLHHYDEIGLLKPGQRSDKGYRLYGEADLLRLQQILLYREMELPLSDIRHILDRPDFDVRGALAGHRTHLLQKLERLQRMIQTIDETCLRLEKPLNVEKMNTAELYEGFRKEEAASWRQEAKRRWGAEFDASEQQLKKMDKEDFVALKAEGEEIVSRLASLMSMPATNPQVQELIGQYYLHLNRFHPIDRNRFLALGEMYVEDPRFTAYYERVAAGLANFVRAGIAEWCNSAE